MVLHYIPGETILDHPVASASSCSLADAMQERSRAIAWSTLMDNPSTYEGYLVRRRDGLGEDDFVYEFWGRKRVAVLTNNLLVD